MVDTRALERLPCTSLKVGAGRPGDAYVLCLHWTDFIVEVKGFTLNVSHERLKEKDGMASCVPSGILHSQFHKMVTDR